jgi:tetratricopeptide (TPR) repeat protein
MLATLAVLATLETAACYRGAGATSTARAPGASKPAAGASGGQANAADEAAEDAGATLEAAERAFEKADLVDARALYERVAQPGVAPELAEFARYKLAWVHLNLGDAARALELFFEVATRATKEALRREAARDLSHAFVHVGRPERALALFQRVDHGRAYELLANLGEHYRELGMYDRARVVLRESANSNPDPARACQAHLDLVQVTTSIGNGRHILAEVAALVPAALGGDASCRAHADELVYDLALSWHAALGTAADEVILWDHVEALATEAARRTEAVQHRARLQGARVP